LELIAACLGTLLFAFALKDGMAQETAALPYMNPQLSPERRAADLVQRMTAAEKATQLQNNSAEVPSCRFFAYQW
jgi:beta-glucosidase